MFLGKIFCPKFHNMYLCFVPYLVTMDVVVGALCKVCYRAVDELLLRVADVARRGTFSILHS